MTKRIEHFYRYGFTLIELLAVLGILSLLAAFLLPAIQDAREASRNLRCRANLKEIALAIANYETLFSCYPPGYITTRVPNTGGFGTNYSAFSLILPQLEQSPLYNAINFSQPGMFVNEVPSANSTAFGKSIGVFFCFPTRSPARLCRA